HQVLVMETPVALLKFVGKALLSAAGVGIVGEFVAEVLPDMARDVFRWWARERSPAQRRAEVEALAQAPAADVRRAADQVARETAADNPPSAHRALSLSLSQAPGTIRQSLRRPADPTGATVPPGLALEQPEDLLPFLPARMPRFQPGDRPLPGVD